MAAGRPDSFVESGPWVWQITTRLDHPTASAITNASVANGANADALFDGVLFDADGQPWTQTHGASPATVVLQLYERYADDCFARLAGHFAMVIHDRRSERVVAGRDRMGQHPLFYTRTNGMWLFSSSIDALLGQPGVSRDPDRLVLAEHLAHRWPDISNTYYAAVSRVPPGHVLEIDRTGARLTRYWDIASKPPLDVGDDEAVDLFERALERAVERAAAPGRSAIFLSGGLDSISIAAVAVDQAQRTGAPRPHALSLGFPDPDCDEEFVQRGVAESLGCSQDFLPLMKAIGPHGLLVSATELSATLPAPLLNVWQPAYAALGRLAPQRGRSVILTGTGGDEWLAVTPYLAADLIRHGDVTGLIEFSGVVQRSYRMTRAEALYGAWWRYGLRPLATRTVDRVAHERFQQRRRRKAIAGTPPWIAPDPGLRAAMDARVDRTLSPSNPDSFYEQEMRTALDHALVSIEHEESFEFGRRLGVSLVHPYCDADLVELLYRLPPRRLYRGGRSKGLVRGAIARRFPALGFERQRKVNATGFYLDVLMREGWRAWDAASRARALDALGVVDGARLTDTITGLLAGGTPSARYRIWSVLNLAAWTEGATRRRSTIGGQG